MCARFSKSRATAHSLSVTNNRRMKVSALELSHSPGSSHTALPLPNCLPEPASPPITLQLPDSSHHYLTHDLSAGMADHGPRHRSRGRSRTFPTAARAILRSLI